MLSRDKKRVKLGNSCFHLQRSIFFFANFLNFLTSNSNFFPYTVFFFSMLLKITYVYFFFFLIFSNFLYLFFNLPTFCLYFKISLTFLWNLSSWIYSNSLSFYLYTGQKSRFLKFIIEISSIDLVPPRKRKLKYPSSETSRKYESTRRRRNLCSLGHLINDPTITRNRYKRKEEGRDLSYDYTSSCVIYINKLTIYRSAA